MTKQEKQKIQTSLIFSQSDLWESVLFILDEAYNAEVSVAISQNQSEINRSHSCGRAEGVKYIKELLEETRNEALKLSNRKNT